MFHDTMLSGRRILAIDDSNDMTSLLRDVFEDMNAHVTQACNGHEALVCLDCGKFDLVLLDLGMPQPDGWKILQFIRNRRPDLLGHTLVITASRYEPDVLDTLRACGVAWLLKPFQLSDLLALTCKLLRENLSSTEEVPIPYHSSPEGWEP